MWLSVAAFFIGGVTVFHGGLRSLEHGAVPRGKVETLSTKETKAPPTPEVDKSADKREPEQYRHRS